MRSGPRTTLEFALRALGAALLGVAALDYLAYEFVLVDLATGERGWSDGVYLWPGLRYSLAGRALIVLAAIGGMAAFGAFALARVRRTAGVLLALAAICAALQLGAAVAAAAVFREELLAHRVTVDPDTSIRWLVHRDLSGYAYPLSVQRIVGALASLSIVATALAGVRVALGRGWPPARAWLTAALAVPLVLATGALAWLWQEFAVPRPGSGFEAHHVAFVQSVRWAIAAAALAIATAAALLLRGTSRARLVFAAGLCALGLAAAVATAPHRRAIDTLAPPPRPAVTPRLSVWLRAPWDFDARVTGACVESPSFDHDVVVFVDDRTGGFAAKIDGFPVPLADEPDDLRAELARHIHPNERLVLFADRRVPVAALMPLLERLPPTEIGRVVVAGITVRALLSAEGPTMAWRGCTIGALHLPTFLRTEFAPGTTWGAILDDPALVPGPEAR
ncbi:hypothetical protein [Nannocystis punicea]|uniref:Uncharacterized protein n=1 Tax=Nannocystis punicea TaxID=2995304 RepID=A0ABY7H957_9BACT|nr:hypothetical protein [Nannocystis poenicansa]WAS95797.1 hypothetical protein O0S08_06505 [Nannocystis poenicansa]